MLVRQNHDVTLELITAKENSNINVVFAICSVKKMYHRPLTSKDNYMRLYSVQWG